jgi:hypothetical protein
MHETIEKAGRGNMISHLSAMQPAVRPEMAALTPFNRQGAGGSLPCQGSPAQARDALGGREGTRSSEVHPFSGKVTPAPSSGPDKGWSCAFSTPLTCVAPVQYRQLRRLLHEASDASYDSGESKDNLAQSLNIIILPLGNRRPKSE